MRSKRAILNKSALGSTTSSARMFLFFRQLNLRFFIYDKVSLCWPEKRLVISHNGTNVIIFQANRRKNIYFCQSNLMQFLKKGHALPIHSLSLIFTYFRVTVQGHQFLLVFISSNFRNTRKLIFTNNNRFQKQPQNRQICTGDEVDLI